MLREILRWTGPAASGRSLRTFPAVLAVLAASISFAARAEDEPRDADELSFYVGTEYTHDDNVDLAASNEDSDAFLSYVAGFDLVRGGRATRLELSYQFRFRDYFDRSEFDQPEHVVYAAYKMEGQVWSLGLEDRLLRTEDPTGLEFTQRQKRLHNDATLTFRRRTAKNGALTLSYTNSLRDYRQSSWDYLSGTENAATAEIAIPITESGRTVAFVSVSLGRYRFDDDLRNGYDYIRGVAGLRGQPGGKLAFEFGVGASGFDDFEDNLAVPDVEDATEFHAFASAAWRVKPERTRVELTYRRADQPSSVSNFQVVTVASLDLIHNFSRRITGDVGCSLESADRSVGDDYDLTKFWTGLRYRIGRRRNGPARGDNAYRGDVHLLYEHTERDSTGAGLEYEANRISLGFTQHF